MKTMLIAAGRQRLPATIIENKGLLELITSTVGLTVNASQEVYAAANQQTAPGDGRNYTFKPRSDGKKVKSIQANFRYTANTPALSTMMIVHKPAGSNAYFAVGVYDEWEAQVGFRLVSDVHATVLRTTSFNGVLKRTFAEPVDLSELYFKIGGRTGYTYSPCYIKDLQIEYV